MLTRCGMASTQCGHQVPQKSSSTSRPCGVRWNCQGWPSRSFSRKSSSRLFASLQNGAEDEIDDGGNVGGRGADAFGPPISAVGELATGFLTISCGRAVSGGCVAA